MGIKNVDECFDVYVRWYNSHGCELSCEGFNSITSAKVWIGMNLNSFEVGDTIEILDGGEDE